MIDVICKTNLDRFNGKRWPTKMVAVPRKGEKVRAEDGAELCVVDVAHGLIPQTHHDRLMRGQPIIYVELHAPPGLEQLYMRKDD